MTWIVVAACAGWLVGWVLGYGACLCRAALIVERAQQQREEVDQPRRLRTMWDGGHER